MPDPDRHLAEPRGSSGRRWTWRVGSQLQRLRGMFHEPARHGRRPAHGSCGRAAPDGHAVRRARFLRVAPPSDDLGGSRQSGSRSPSPNNRIRSVLDRPRPFTAAAAGRPWRALAAVAASITSRRMRRSPSPMSQRQTPAAPMRPRRPPRARTAPRRHDDARRDQADEDSPDDCGTRAPVRPLGWNERGALRAPRLLGALLQRNRRTAQEREPRRLDLQRPDTRTDCRIGFHTLN